MNTPGHKLTNNHIRLGQETNQIWTQEAGTHDTHNRTLTVRPCLQCNVITTLISAVRALTC